MDTLAPAPPLAPDVAADTRRRRWPWVTSIVLAVALSAMFLWLLNWEPLGAQSTVFSAYPPDRMIARIDADPALPSLAQDRLSLGKEEEFGYLFWLHNDSPFPITITGVGTEEGSTELHYTKVRLGPASNSAPTAHPTSSLPYTLSPGADAAIEVRMYIEGCIEDRMTIGISGVPISYEMFGLIHHDTTISMPVMVAVVGPSHSPSCS